MRQAVRLALSLGLLAALGAAKGGKWSVAWTPVANSTNPCYRLHDGSELCFPSIIIAGLPKSGTSALWYMLSSHPDVVSGPAKEHCPEPRQRAPNLKRALKWAKGLPVEHSKVIVNGCLAYWRYPHIFKRFREDLGVTGVKVVQMFRDYPSWQMSHFRWLCHPCIGEDPKCNRSARTPKEFARFLEAPECKPEHLYVNVSLRGQYQAMHNALGGSNNYQVLDQADLLSRPKEALRHLHKFLGLRDYEYPEDVLASIVNHNEVPGFKPAASKAVQPGQYTTTSSSSSRKEANSLGQGRAKTSGMDDATLQKLQDKFRPDCEWLRQNAGLCMESCCNGSQQ